MGEQDKKSYKEINGTTRVGDFLRSIGKGDTFERIAGTIGELASGDVLGAIKTALNSSTELTEAQREYALKMAELDFREEEEITKRWQSDMSSDSWMAKNIRPYNLAILTAFLMFIILLDSSITGFKVEDIWIDMLQSLLLLIYGAYYGSRAVEKITDKVGKIRKKL